MNEKSWRGKHFKISNSKAVDLAKHSCFLVHPCNFWRWLFFLAAVGNWIIICLSLFVSKFFLCFIVWWLHSITHMKKYIKCWNIDVVIGLRKKLSIEIRFSTSAIDEVDHFDWIDVLKSIFAVKRCPWLLEILYPDWIVRDLHLIRSSELVKAAASEVVCYDDVSDSVKHKLDILGVSSTSHVTIDFLCCRLVLGFKLGLDVGSCLAILLSSRIFWKADREGRPQDLLLKQVFFVQE